MTEYQYLIDPKCYDEINSFYEHVALKYRHTYSEELMHQNIDDAVDAMFQIERTLHRRKPTLRKWAGYHMANTDKWYYAYLILDDVIVVVDACHAQNMHEKLPTEDEP